MSAGLMHRYTFGVRPWPSSLTRVSSLDQLARINIEAQRAAAQDISANYSRAAATVAAEINHQTNLLESHISRLGDEIRKEIAIGSRQIVEAVEYLSDRVSTHLEDISWQLRQQNETLQGILLTLKNSRNNEAQQLLRQGRRHYFNCEFDEAEERFRKALEFDSTDYQVLMNLAFTALNRNDSTQALFYFKKALTLPEDIGIKERTATLWAIARLHYVTGDYKESHETSLEVFKSLNEILPRDYYLAAVYAFGAKENAYARKCLEKSVENNPSLWGVAAADPDLYEHRPVVMTILTRICEDANSQLRRLMTECQSLANDALSNNMPESVLNELKILSNRLSKCLSGDFIHAYSSAIGMMLVMDKLRNTLRSTYLLFENYKKIDIEKEILRELTTKREDSGRVDNTDWKKIRHIGYIGLYIFPAIAFSILGVVDVVRHGSILDKLLKLIFVPILAIIWPVMLIIDLKSPWVSYMILAFGLAVGMIVVGTAYKNRQTSVNAKIKDISDRVANQNNKVLELKKDYEEKRKLYIDDIRECAGVL